MALGRFSDSFSVDYFCAALATFPYIRERGERTGEGEARSGAREEAPSSKINVFN